ncbi:cell surface protein SprA, partial [Fischerella thermalis CCMEE 5319]
YVFQQLYDSTRFRAQEMTKLNKFFLRGRYKSASGSEIQLNAINIPRGSVSVTAGGVKLQEGTQYTVDYNLGRVRILDEGIINSGLPIRVDFENNALFGANVKSFAGINVDHRVSEHWNIGGTLLHLRERPFTQKVNLGFEPIANTIWGLNTQYSKEAPILTKLVDALPFISTKAPSTINAQGEFAQLIPGSPRAIKLDREETTYIDDFESSQTLIDIRNPMRWQLASIPSGQSDLFPESELNNDIRIGFNRARIAWYTIDPLFFQANSQTPANVRA